MRVEGLGSSVEGLGSELKGLGMSVLGLGWRVEGDGLTVWALWFGKRGERRKGRI